MDSPQVASVIADGEEDEGARAAIYREEVWEISHSLVVAIASMGCSSCTNQDNHSYGYDHNGLQWMEQIIYGIYWLQFQKGLQYNGLYYITK